MPPKKGSKKAAAAKGKNPKTHTKTHKHTIVLTILMLYL